MKTTNDTLRAQVEKLRAKHSKLFQEKQFSKMPTVQAKIIGLLNRIKERQEKGLK